MPKDGDVDGKALAIDDCVRIYDLSAKTYGTDNPATVAAKHALDDARRRRDESKPMAVQLTNAERKTKAKGQAVEAAKEKLEQTRKRLQEEEVALAARVSEKEAAGKEVAELAAKVASGGGAAARSGSGDGVAKKPSDELGVVLEILSRLGPQVGAADGKDVGQFAEWVKNEREKAVQQLDPREPAAPQGSAANPMEVDKAAADDVEANTLQGKSKRIELALLAHGVEVQEGDVEAMELQFQVLSKRQRA